MRSRRSLFWLLQTGGWSAFFLAMFVAGISHWPVGYSAVHKATLAVPGFLASLFLRSVFIVLERRRIPLPAIAVTAVPISFATAAPWMAAHRFLVLAWQGDLHAARSAFPDFTNTIYYSFVLIAWSGLYFGIRTYLDRQDDRERLLKAEAGAQEARLRALRLQLNPHFLFNALNGISTLIAEGRPEEASTMLEKLSGFLRAALDGPSGVEVPLASEVALARQYLEIEQIRFGDRLRVEIDVDRGAARALVPPMILQPLVENAVKHAVAPSASGGAIGIRASRTDSRLHLSVRDGGGATPTRGAGIGLANTRARLSELYGEASSLRFEEEGRGTVVSIEVPYREERA